MVKFLDSAGLSALWNKIKSTFYTKGEVYNKNELDDIVAHELTVSISGDLTPEIPTVNDIINDANAHSVKISPNSVFTRQSSGTVTSTRIFPFSDIQNITVYVREAYVGGTLNHYGLGNILGIFLAENTYLTISISGYNVVLVQYINGTLAHSVTLGAINSSSGVYINTYGDFAVVFNKNEKLFRILGYDTTNSTIVQRALYSIENWDLSSLLNIYLKTTTYSYGTNVCCTNVLVNSPSLSPSYIAASLKIGEYNNPLGSSFDENICLIGTEITTNGTIVESISDIDKVISVSKSSEDYFKLGLTNTDEKFKCYHLKIVFTSVGEGSYITAGLISSIRYESEGLYIGSGKLIPVVGKVYDLYLTKSRDYGYTIMYGLRIKGNLTFEVSEPYLYNPQILNICAETYNGTLFSGAIPFKGSVSFVEYLASNNIASNRIPLYATKVESGIIKMWNGSTWKNISS